MQSVNTVDRLLDVARRVVDRRHQTTLTPASLLFEEELLDSFGILQLVAETEKEFSIEIRTEDLTVQNFASIADIALLVERCMAAEN